MRQLTRLTAAIIAASLVTGACGPNPAETYYDEVESITRIMRRDSIAALPDPGLVTREGVIGVNAARQTALDGMTALVPPVELSSEHQSFIAALEELTLATDRFLGETATLDTVDFRAAARASAELDEAAMAFDLACDALEARAPELDLTNELGC